MASIVDENILGWEVWMVFPTPYSSVAGNIREQWMDDRRVLVATLYSYATRALKGF